MAGNKSNTSGLSISVTDKERQAITDLQELTGLGRKPLIMMLVTKEARAIKGAKPKTADKK